MRENRIFLGRPYVMSGETKRTTEEDELAATRLSLTQMTEECEKLRKAVRNVGGVLEEIEGGMRPFRRILESILSDDCFNSDLRTDAQTLLKVLEEE